LWQADNVKSVYARAERLAEAIGGSPQRLLHWCSAFAPMTALERAETSEDAQRGVSWLLALATDIT
jgi:hypothetical protein